MRNLFRLVVSVSLALGMASSQAGAQTSGDGRMVVMISLDGLAQFYMDDPKAEMPTIRRLVEEGARVEGMRASTPTVTWPNHTTLVTGVHPSRHGVVGNNYLDRKSRKPVTLLTDPEFDKDQIVKTPTIYDLAKQAGLSTAAVIWPASRNAKTLDWTVPDVSTDALFQKYSTPALLAECKTASIPYEKHGEWCKAGDYEARDRLNTDIFKLILTKHKPNFSLLHLINVDHMQHLKGPRTPEAYASIKGVDAQVAEVWETLKQVAPAGKASLVIVSDHGFHPIQQAILPNVVLREAGLVEVKGTRVVGGSVQIVTQGGACFVYVLEGGDATAAQAVEAFKKTEGVAKVVTPEGFAEYGVADPKADPHAPDLILFAKSGYSFGTTSAGELPVTAKSAEVRGTHGHDANDPQLHATFIAWGAGVPKGTKLGLISNTDVAPTVANMLGLTMNDVDGKPLFKP